MILIKDRHNHFLMTQFYLLKQGKYDTYKGSTLKHHIVSILCSGGNMILIKDRHIWNELTVNQVFELGKYDTYKGSTRLTSARAVRAR